MEEPGFSEQLLGLTNEELQQAVAPALAHDPGEHHYSLSRRALAFTALAAGTFAVAAGVSTIDFETQGNSHQAYQHNRASVAEPTPTQAAPETTPPHNVLAIHRPHHRVAQAVTPSKPPVLKASAIYGHIAPTRQVESVRSAPAIVHHATHGSSTKPHAKTQHHGNFHGGAQYVYNATPQELKTTGGAVATL